MSNILTKEQIKYLKISGRILAEVMEVIKNSVKPGVDTLTLDQIAESELLKRNSKPAFKNYYVEGAGSFPASLCTSINEEIVHGIPSKDRILKEGDIISLDFGAEYHGIYTDMTVTVPVGKISEEAKKLISVTKKSLEIGIQQAKVGNNIIDIGKAVEKYVIENGFDVVREYVGHGIGTEPHMSPQIPNFNDGYRHEAILENMALAIEPMVVMGNFRTKVEKNNWTVKTIDNKLSAHFEHTVLIENGNPIIVTKISN